MSTRLNLEHIEVMDDAMAEVLRAKSGAERLQIASGIYASARQMLTSFLREQHPEWQEPMLQREVARRLSHGAF